MKRTLVLVLLAAFLVSSFGSASAVQLKGVSVKAGAGFFFNDFQFDGESQLDRDTKVGVVGGASSLWRWSRRSPWMIVVEALYVGKGYKGTRSLASDAGRVDVDVSASYLSVPLMARVNFSEDDLTTYAVFGPTLEFLLSRDDDTLLDDFRGWAIGGGVGMGFELEVAERAKLLLEFRFNTDFTDNWDGPEEVMLSSAKHRALLVTTGVRF